MDVTKVKLVVWDLDETFWSGTLSEEGITPIAENVDLIRRLTDCGIINSICSKNDAAPVDATLRELGIVDLFVMPSVDWSPKGQRLQRLIDDMQLRAPNVLFLDDNHLNREEALFYCPGLMTAGPETIAELMEFVADAPVADPQHTRLQRYKILETKVQERASSSSNDAFLRDSDIHVRFHDDTLDQLDRMAELVSRTNQLNFTKNRMPRDELASLIADPATTSAYVSVRDRFGEYGTVGFYAVRDGELVHFAFSCSTIGMGIEQFAYHHIGRPRLTVVGDVVSSLDGDQAPDWITVDEGDAPAAKDPEPTTHGSRRILFKGPCDISSLIPYLDARAGRFDTEFNHPDERGVMITAHNHTAHIVESVSRTRAEVELLLAQAPFLNADAFSTDMFTGYDAVVLSLLPDSHEGLYRLKADPSLAVSFSSFTFDLTDPAHWGDFVDGTFVNHGYPFTRDELSAFAERFEFAGPIPVAEMVTNLELIRDRLDDSALLLLLLGSEVAPGGETLEFRDHAQRHHEVNRAAEGFATGRRNVRIVNFTDIVTGDDDFAAGINHLKRRKYLELAGRISAVLNDYFDEDVAGTVRGDQSFLRRAVRSLRSGLARV
jgi:FkbH-like protein